MPMLRRRFAQPRRSLTHGAQASVASMQTTDSMPERRSTWHAIAPLALLACVAATVPTSAQEQSDADGVALIEGLQWQRGSNGASVPWDAAQEYCETLEHAGFDDWRLPTLAELEKLHDPTQESGLRPPLELDDCCVWSATNLVDEPAERKGQLPPPTNAPADYFWGYLFASGVRYYSFRRFPDGLAMCVRDP